MIPRLTARQANALYAVAATRAGMRVNTHVATIPVLEAMGLVHEKDRDEGRPGERVWVLTPDGLKVLAALEWGEA